MSICLLTTKEMTQYLGCSPRTVVRVIRGEVSEIERLPGVRIGGRWFVEKGHFLGWLDRNPVILLTPGYIKGRRKHSLESWIEFSKNRAALNAGCSASM